MNNTLKARRQYQQIILSRSRSPHHFGKTNPVHLRLVGENPYCRDSVEITIAVDENKIRDLKFIGSGCALCIASADLMAETVKGKTTQEALKICESFHRVILGEAELTSSLQHLKAIEGAKRYPVKAKCATLAWHTLKAAILSSESIHNEAHS